MSDDQLTLFPKLKRCSKCKKHFPATTEYFYKQASRLTSACITCSKRIAKEKHLANPEIRRGYDQARYAKNPEKHRASTRNDYFKHKTRKKAKNKLWIAANRDRLNTYNRNRYHANPEQS